MTEAPPVPPRTSSHQPLARWPAVNLQVNSQNQVSLPRGSRIPEAVNPTVRRPAEYPPEHPGTRQRRPQRPRAIVTPSDARLLPQSEPSATVAAVKYPQQKIYENDEGSFDEQDDDESSDAGNGTPQAPSETVKPNEDVADLSSAPSETTAPAVTAVAQAVGPATASSVTAVASDVGPATASSVTAVASAVGSATASSVTAVASAVGPATASSVTAVASDVGPATASSVTAVASDVRPATTSSVTAEPSAVGSAPASLDEPRANASSPRLTSVEVQTDDPPAVEDRNFARPSGPELGVPFVPSVASDDSASVDSDNSANSGRRATGQAASRIPVNVAGSQRSASSTHPSRHRANRGSFGGSQTSVVSQDSSQPVVHNHYYNHPVTRIIHNHYYSNCTINQHNNRPRDQQQEDPSN